MINRQNLKDILFYIPFLNYLFLDENRSVVLKSSIFSHGDDVLYLTYYNYTYNLYNRRLMKNKSPLKTDKEKIEFMRIVSDMKFNNDETKLIKIGDKYFKVKELG
jgi:hypothetical protein